MGTPIADRYVQRFWSRVKRGNPEECWLWTRGQSTKGYGVFYAGKMVPAHRMAFELTNGPVPDGLVLDHLCRVRMCVNPAHLEPVTVAENNLRGVGAPAANARKAACHRGHVYSEGAFYQMKGTRVCKQCQKERSAAYYRRRVGQPAAVGA